MRAQIRNIYIYTSRCECMLGFMKEWIDLGVNEVTDVPNVN